ncbi:MAG: hypothetical protein U5N56_04770 [Candidatus Marinimicrobia bacterium]|nr:hypothetical protein [Candidatus Neomarinimicrobiota bacterium]
MHWSMGGVGYFPSYAMGNLYGAQIIEQAKKDIPDLYEKTGAGDFLPLTTWLKKNVHLQGRRYDPEKLIEVISGRIPQPGPLHGLSGKEIFGNLQAVKAAEFVLFAGGKLLEG